MNKKKNYVSDHLVRYSLSSSIVFGLFHLLREIFDSLVAKWLKRTYTSFFRLLIIVALIKNDKHWIALAVINVGIWCFSSICVIEN